jgi:MATE family multidrug resistance protein
MNADGDKNSDDHEVEEGININITSSNNEGIEVDNDNNAGGPYAFSKHLRGIASLTWPIIISEFFQNTLPVVDIAFVGRLTAKEDLAAAALATVWFNLWNATMLGFCTAVDTLLSQSFGAQEYRVFSMWTGTSLFIVFLVSFLVIGLIALCQPVMVAFGQNPVIAQAAGQFSYRLIPGLLPYYISRVLVKYLHAQNILIPPMIIGLFANLFNVFTNWLFISYLQMGLNGAPIATSMTRCFELIVFVVFIYWNKSGSLNRTWPYFSVQNLKSDTVMTFMIMAIYSALSFMAEAWSFEITTIFAGLLGTLALDAHVITLTIATFIYLSFPSAIGLATSIRVGKLIGEGSAPDAKRSYIVSFCLSIVVQGTLVVVLISISDNVGKFFSSDESVSSLISNLLPLSCIFMLGDAIQANSRGAFRGLGKQKLLLILNIIGFLFLALPCGALLTFVANIGVRGLWLGMTIGIYSSSIMGVVLLNFVTNWQREAEIAKNRVVITQEACFNESQEST